MAERLRKGIVLDDLQVDGFMEICEGPISARKLIDMLGMTGVL